MSRTLPALFAACLVLAACSKPEAPEHDAPPEPQAAATAARPAELTEAIQQPLDKAGAAQAATEAASAQQDTAIRDATADATGD